MTEPVYSGGVNFAAAATGRCPVCGTDFRATDTGDGPVVFVRLIAGFASCFGMLYAFLAWNGPAWLYLVVWPLFACALSPGLMQPLKGLMVAAQLKNRFRD